jgi:tRNA A37 threonylcarbamoyltransferase TsaD
VGNEEHGYPVPDLNKTMINVTKKPSNAHQNTLKEQTLQEITKKFMEKILDMVNKKCTRCTQEISRHQK